MSHLQFVNDELEKQQNRLARTINNLNCEVRRLRHAQATATAQYNGWLAAAQLNLTTCTKLIASGSTILVKKCKPQQIVTETEITRCGPQLRYGDHTLNVDGWELVKYSPCYSNLGFVNINGRARILENGSWSKLKIDEIYPTEPLTPDFKYPARRTRLTRKQRSVI